MGVPKIQDKGYVTLSGAKGLRDSHRDASLPSHRTEAVSPFGLRARDLLSKSGETALGSMT